jgi:hypothetical protein
MRLRKLWVGYSFSIARPILRCIFLFRLYGFKIHHLAYQIQQQAAANFKAPMRTMSYNSGKR